MLIFLYSHHKAAASRKVGVTCTASDHILCVRITSTCCMQFQCRCLLCRQSVCNSRRFLHYRSVSWRHVSSCLPMVITGISNVHSRTFESLRTVRGAHSTDSTTADPRPWRQFLLLFGVLQSDVRCNKADSVRWKNNKYYVFWVCVSVSTLRYPASNAHAPYCVVIRGLPGCTVVFHRIS
jgi:hypothetical protein